MTAPNTTQHNGVVERSFETDLNCIRSIPYQATFTQEMASRLWEMAVLYLQHTSNMTSTMAVSSNKLSSNTKFNNEKNIEIERMQPFGRIRFVTIRSKMKRKLSKRSYKAIMVVIPKHHSTNSYYTCNTETRRIVIGRDITWAPFVRPHINEGLDEVWRRKMNDKENEVSSETSERGG